MDPSIYENPALYDRQYHCLTRDARYYAKLASKTGGPILEIGVGTGRIAHEILKNNLSYTGIDTSENMLLHARQRLKPYGNRVALHHSDLIHFRPTTPFALLFAGFNTLHHLLSHDAWPPFLTSVRHHLSPSGLFAFDLINPTSPHWTRHDITPVIRECFYDDLKTCSCTLMETSTFNSLTGIKQYSWVYEWTNGEKVRHSLEHRIYQPDEIQNLFVQNGFSLVSLFGGFDRSPYTKLSDRMIFVWKSIS